MKQIPKPERISQWGSATEIIYQCRNCGGSFSFYGQQEKFCHLCGCENDWTGVPSHLDKEIARKYHNADYQTRCEIMKALDRKLAEKQ